MSKKAILYLKNGQIFTGEGVGSNSKKFGECVFTTAMTGYTESLTDPSYAGQILCFAYPLQGNYKTSKDWYESESMYAEGVIASSVSQGFYRDGGDSLDEFLSKQGKSAITGIDTRKLVKTLRNEGNQPCVLIVDEEEVIESHLTRIKSLNNFEFIANETSNKNDIGFVQWTKRVNEVSGKFNDNWSYSVLSNINNTKVVVIDCGVKENIIRELSKRFGEVIVVKSNSSASQVMSLNPNGILFSNGPGDPRDCQDTINCMKELLETTNLPIMGICLGHQILSIASGADVYKMKFGNRGGNQPVIDLTTNKAYLTSQNHGYATDPSTLTGEFGIYFKNLNDDSVEGIIHKSRPIFSVQFHPEACCGPQDTNFLFDKFAENVRKNKTN